MLVSAMKANEPGATAVLPEPSQSSGSLMRRLHTGPRGLTSEDASARSVQYGANVLTRHSGNSIWRSILAQLVHPLALLLIGAAALSFVSNSPTLAWTILAVVLLNAAFALQQEHQAERSVEALNALVPHQATVLRDGRVNDDRRCQPRTWRPAGRV